MPNSITAKELQAILNTLPIGYYAGGRVEVVIDEEAETSYFSPMERKISISKNGLNEMLKNGKLDKEVAARGHLYHELSHAILTPPIMDNASIYNIFEDERIETLLQDYYLKVNFKENIKIYTGYNGAKPRNADEEFFYTVRFRTGRPQFVKEVQEIIDKYSQINWNSNAASVNQYEHDILNLYREIHRCSPMTNEEWEAAKKAAEKAAKKAAEKEANIPDKYNKAEQADSQRQKEGNDAGEQEGDSTEGQEGNGKSKTEEQESNEEGLGTAHPTKGGEKQLSIRNILNQAFSAGDDQELYQALDAILVSFRKRNSGGSALQAHSGIFNPRSAGREDYRFFDRQATINGSNPYGTLHLNLFLDQSGSFYNNAQAANNIIRTLWRLEQKHSFFSVDFIFLDNEVTHMKDKTKAILHPFGGNYIPQYAERLFTDLQKKGTCNYNILLMDGLTNSFWEETKGEYYPFDRTNTTFILDPTCKRYGGDRIRNGKVIYSQKYLEELNKNIILTFQQAFR